MARRLSQPLDRLNDRRAAELGGGRAPYSHAAAAEEGQAMTSVVGGQVEITGLRGGRAHV